MLRLSDNLIKLELNYELYDNKIFFKFFLKIVIASKRIKGNVFFMLAYLLVAMLLAFKISAMYVRFLLCN